LIQTIVAAEVFAEAADTVLFHELFGALVRTHARYQVLKTELISTVLAAECLASQLAAVCYRFQFEALPASFFGADVLPIFLFFVFVCVGTGADSAVLRLLSFFT